MSPLAALCRGLNIILTRDSTWQARACPVATSMEQAVEVAEGQALIDGADSVMVIGGAEVYRRRCHLRREHSLHVSMETFMAMRFLILTKLRRGAS